MKFGKESVSSRRYKWLGQVPITANQEFDSWKNLSKPRFVIANNDKIFISDLGLHKIYIIDLKTGAQSAIGYLGPNPGQFRRPTGMIQDEIGNLIVCDSGNNQLQVYSREGKYVKLATQIDNGLLSPQGLCRVNDTIYVAFKGGRIGAVVKYSLFIEC